MSKKSHLPRGLTYAWEFERLGPTVFACHPDDKDKPHAHIRHVARIDGTPVNRQAHWPNHYALTEKDIDSILSGKDDRRLLTVPKDVLALAKAAFEKAAAEKQQPGLHLVERPVQPVSSAQPAAQAAALVA